MSGHDLIFFEKRSTPKVVSTGMKFTAPESYGKQTKRRAATAAEEKQIKNGQWVRVDEKGTKGGQPGYKKTKMAGREHLVSHEEDVDDFLAHFGVKGMKWGVRNNDSSGSTSNATKSSTSSDSASKEARTAAKREARAVRKEKTAQKYTEINERFSKNPKPIYLTKDSYERYKRNNQKEIVRNIKAAKDIRDGKLTDRQKQLIVGASVAVGLMAAYGAYKYVDSGEFNQMKNKGLAFLTGKEFAFKKNAKLAGDMDADGIFNNVVKHINPNYGAYGTKMNCRRATFAYEMRRRGYDVKATLSNAATGQNQLGIHNALNPGENLPTRGFGLYRKIVTEAYENKDKLDPGTGRDRLGPLTKLLQSGGDQSAWGANVIRLDAPTKYKLTNDIMHPDFLKKANAPDRGLAIADSIFRDLSKQPDRARGELGVGWTLGGGHSMAWEKVRGKIHIFDNQTGEHYKTPEAFKKFAESITEAGFTRLDNVELNTDFLQRWVTNV